MKSAVTLSRPVDTKDVLRLNFYSLVNRSYFFWLTVPNSLAVDLVLTSPNPQVTFQWERKKKFRGGKKGGVNWDGKRDTKDVRLEVRDVRLEMRDWKRNARDERVCGVLDVRGEGCCGDKSGSPTYKCRNCRHIFATSSQVLLNPVLRVIFLQWEWWCVCPALLK